MDSHWPEWVADAACIEIGTDPFFPEQGEDWNPSKRVCNELCGVRLECLDYAMTRELGQDRKTRWGLWGGMSPLQRGQFEPVWLAERTGDAA